MVGIGRWEVGHKTCGKWEMGLVGDGLSKAVGDGRLASKTFQFKR